VPITIHTSALVASSPIPIRRIGDRGCDRAAGATLNLCSSRRRATWRERLAGSNARRRPSLSADYSCETAVKSNNTPGDRSIETVRVGERRCDVARLFLEQVRAGTAHEEAVSASVSAERETYRTARRTGSFWKAYRQGSSSALPTEGRALVTCVLSSVRTTRERIGRDTSADLGRHLCLLRPCGGRAEFVGVGGDRRLAFAPSYISPGEIPRRGGVVHRARNLGSPLRVPARHAVAAATGPRRRWAYSPSYASAGDL